MTQPPCRLPEHNPDLWFGTKTAEAKKLCKRCPIRESCESEGWNHADGVFGGLSAADRRREDPARYAAAIERSKALSAEMDRLIIAARAARLAEARRAGVCK